MFLLLLGYLHVWTHVGLHVCMRGFPVARGERSPAVQSGAGRAVVFLNLTLCVRSEELGLAKKASSGCNYILISCECAGIEFSRHSTMSIHPFCVLCVFFFVGG